MCIDNNIDRMSFGVFNTLNNVIEEDDLKICSINVDYSNRFGLSLSSDSFYTPYDYAPSIYNRNKFIKLCETFIFDTYETFERNESVQKYVNANFKCYGIQKNNNIELVYHRGFVYSNDLNILHITVCGTLLPYHLYFDLENKVKDILQEYNISLKQYDSVNINKNTI